MADADLAAHWTARLHDLAAAAGVPGATLGIWADGRVTLAAHGVLNAATGVTTTVGSLFQIGSVTKVWTGTMIMQLVDEGRLSLDTTVSEVLPGTPLGRPDASAQVTVRHLLTHTSSIDGDIFTDTGRGADCVERYAGELAQAARIFRACAGIAVPAGPEPAAGPLDLDLRRHAGRYGRTSWRYDVAVRDGRLHVIPGMTDDREAFSDDEPQEFDLYPADATGDHFVGRLYDSSPWAPVVFGRLGDQTPYVYAGGRVTPRIG